MIIQIEKWVLEDVTEQYKVEEIVFFKIILLVLVLYALISPFFYAKAMKFGMKIAEKETDKAETPIFNVPAPKKKPQLTRKERQEIQKWQNIMRYNGTSAGQVKISEVK